MLSFAIAFSSFLVIAKTVVPLPSELFSPFISSKILAVAKNESNPPRYPQYTDRITGIWEDFVPDTWTTGFFPVTLYALNTRAELCHKNDGDSWVELGRQWSTGEIPLETKNTQGHDVGFLSMPFQEEYYFNRMNQTAITALKAFAADLDARFSPIVGCTRSWDRSNSPTWFEVIIDNMMNLEILFVGAEITGNDKYRQHAISHADKTMVNHIRPDGSSYHLVNYNANTGDVISRGTVQGYSNSSTWSRGQAWGIYGFANMFNRTRDLNYLTTARRMAGYFVDHIPSDGIVPWDFNAPLHPPRPADTSAATIAATGLLLLANMEKSLMPSNITGHQFWTERASQILVDTTKLGWKPDWQSLLSNGTVNNRASPPNNLTGIVYGDYYYVKAGNDLIKMGKAECPSN